MNTIHVVAGSATAPTAMAAYDAALADANLHNYNLVRVSSVIPAGATVERVDRAPDLGPAGNRLTVVEAHGTTAGPGTVAAGLGWATGPDAGLFYEAAGENPAEVRTTVETGLAAGRDLREWRFTDETVLVEVAEADPGEYAAAVAVAAYGESEPVL